MTQDGPPAEQAEQLENRLAPRLVGTVNWRGIWTLYAKEVHRFLKITMQSIVAPVVTTLLFLAVFSLAFGDRDVLGGEVSFQRFLAPGLMMMAIVQNSFANSASSLLLSKIQGNIVDLMMPPLGPGELSLCFALSGATRGLLCAAAVALGMVLFVDISVAHVWPILFHGLAAALLLSQIGITAGIWADKFDHMATVTNFVITPLAFLSGTFYSIDRLPEPWHGLSQINPFFYMIDGFRYGFIDHADGSLAAGIAIMIALNVVLWSANYLILRSGYKLKS
ncbi:MAG: ABC transporter permease [Alphaproteobacteria bacterium]|nr:ABC transporter permease [Alphaproteobacteria bacterium]